VTTELPILCKACSRWQGATCLSFPEGIPEEIIRYGGDHRVSRDGEVPFQLDPARQPFFDLWLRYTPQADEEVTT
jgi:hypothetical protein